MRTVILPGECLLTFPSAKHISTVIHTWNTIFSHNISASQMTKGCVICVQMNSSSRRAGGFVTVIGILNVSVCETHQKHKSHNGMLRFCQMTEYASSPVSDS